MRPKEGDLLTPEKENARGDFLDVEEELERVDKELKQEGGPLFKRGTMNPKRVSFDFNAPAKYEQEEENEKEATFKQPRQ